MGGYGDSFDLINAKGSPIKELNELANYFDLFTASMILDILQFKGVMKKNLFIAYKDRTEVDIDDCPGIYFFCDFSIQEIKYIGSTNNLKKRLSEHNSPRDKKYFNDNIIFIGCKNIQPTTMRRIEKALILLLTPGRNNLSYLDGKERR